MTRRGDRIPGLWLNKNGRLHFASDVNGISNYTTDSKTPFPLNRWVSIVIEQKNTKPGVYLYSINVDGKKICEVENKDVKLYKNVKVYAADPWHASANAYIRNLQTTTSCAKKLTVGNKCQNNCDCKYICSATMKKCC
jgi:hypothetical protein